MKAHSVRRRLGSDSGFLLIEVMVSALLLVTVSLAAMQALDRSDQLAGDQQKRTIGANVAQAELERVRSLPIEDVANLRATGNGQSTTTLNGVNYTVQTGSKWLTDGRDTVDCSAANGGLDYLQVTTQVSWKGMRAKPVKMSTLLSPSSRSTNAAHGSLSVQLTDAGNNGLPNMPVSLTGGDSFNDSTDDNGCVAWGDLDASVPWELQFSRPGFVDINGNQDVDDTINLAGGSTTSRQYLYDRAGWMDLTFKTRQIDPNTGSGTVDTTSTQQVVTTANSQIPSDRIFKLPATPPKPWEWYDPNTKFFPFQSAPYTVYAGSCNSDMPPRTNVDIISAPAYVNVGAGITQGASVWVPAINVVVKQGGSPVNNAKVVVTDPCGDSYTRYTNVKGLLDDQGFPYFSANGTICVSGGSPSRKVTLTTNNMSYASPTVKNASIPTSGVGGTC